MPTLLERNTQLNGYRDCDSCKKQSTCERFGCLITNWAYFCGKFEKKGA